ncbi:hypothetical protein D9M71_609100 [compost metagenome]
MCVDRREVAGAQQEQFPAGSSEAVVSCLDVIGDQDVRPLTLELRSDTHTRYRGGLVQRLQVDVHVVALVRGTVTTRLVWPEPAQQAPRLDHSDDEDSNVRRLLLTARHDQGAGTLVSDQAPHNVQRCQGTLGLASLCSNHAVTWTILHVVCDIGLHFRQLKAEELHAQLREVAEPCECGREH